jgi:hypothetical protein
MSKSICKIGNILIEIVIPFIAAIKSGWANVCGNSGFWGCAESIATGQIVEKLKNQGKYQFTTTINKYCKFFSCRMSSDEWRGRGKINKIFEKMAEIQEGGLAAPFGVPFPRKVKTQRRFGEDEITSELIRPEKSIITSILFFCIPGIFYNLQKKRIVDCIYINCLKETKRGMPLSLCSAQRDYGTCKYFWGQIFNAIPFVSTSIADFAQSIKKILSHPLEAMGWVIQQACSRTCKSPTGWFCRFCTILNFLDIFKEITCDLGIGPGCEPIWSELTVKDDVCKIALENIEEEEET